MDWNMLIGVLITICLILIVIGFVRLTWPFWSGLGGTLGLSDAFPMMRKLFGMS